MNQNIFAGQSIVIIIIRNNDDHLSFSYKLIVRMAVLVVEVIRIHVLVEPLLSILISPTSKEVHLVIVLARRKSLDGGTLFFRLQGELFIDVSSQVVHASSGSEIGDDGSKVVGLEDGSVVADVEGSSLLELVERVAGCLVAGPSVGLELVFVGIAEDDEVTYKG